MSDLKPNFTDVNSRPIVTRLVDKNDFEYLSVELLNEDGSTELLILMNMYDAKKMHHACELFMQRTVAKDFSGVSGHLSPSERADMFNDEDV